MTTLAIDHPIDPATLLAPKAESMTDAERLAWITEVAADLRLSWLDVARYTGYSFSTVGAWFTSQESIRHRPVPARAIARLQLEVKAGNVQGSK